MVNSTQGVAQGSEVFEIDYLWVGEHTNTGDAIAVRFTDPSSNTNRIVVVDGGFADTAVRIADHVRTYYNTSVVDLVVCTHPDDDHINGLFGLFEELTIRNLLIHRPAEHGYAGDNDVKATKVEELVALALSKGANIESEGFAGTQYYGGTLTIMGPSLDYYREQLAEESSAGVSATFGVTKSAAGLSPVPTDPGETLVGDNGGTTARNNSSIIITLQVEGRRALFTGDAGAPALELAVANMSTWNLAATPLNFFDVPHHGSRHNLTPELLDALLGESNAAKIGCAYVSVGKEADDFPRAEVANAIRRRGYPVYATRGQNIWWHYGSPERAAYTAIDPISWVQE
jgi:beta-lactamase superfamily II metal-dependent hydrolase